MPVPYKPTKKDGRAVAEDNEIKVLMALRHFGHLRKQEIGLAVWPYTTPKSAHVMTWRTVSRLLEKGLVLERPNALGGQSLVLTSRAVTKLKELGVNAQDGYELSSDGPQFYHRTLGTCYLLEKAQTGNEVFGEYALLKGWGPVEKEFVRDKFKKVPDGLVVYSGEALGLRSDLRAADWLEVESAYKSYDDVSRALRILSRDSSLNKAGDVVLNKLVFVYDSRQNHEKQLARYLRKFLKENPNLSRELVLNEIVFARCYLDTPFKWHGTEEISALEIIGTDFVTDNADDYAYDDIL